MVDALQFSDDSNGDIGGNIEAAFEVLYKVAEENNEEKTRKQLLEYCLRAFDDEIYVGWDWHMGVLELSVILIQTGNEAEQVLNRIDLGEKPGLAKEWYDWLLKIAQDQNDTKRIIEYARYLFIDNFRNEQDYYQVLKDHVKPDDWDDLVDGMIEEIKTKKRWLDFHLLGSIYIWEERWEKLLDLVRTSQWI